MEYCSRAFELAELLLVYIVYGVATRGQGDGQRIAVGLQLAAHLPVEYPQFPFSGGVVAYVVEYVNECPVGLPVHLF